MRNLRDIYLALCASYATQMRIARFIISGGTATAVNLGALFILTHLFHIWYLFSSVLAFGASFLVSFTLHKFWTFGDTSQDRIHVQASLFFLVIVTALGINTGLLYTFVEYAHLHYLVAQFISGIFIAFINYFSYKHLVFRVEDPSTAPTENSRPVLTRLFFLACATVTFLILALYRLPENPPTWLDEGAITQVSINLAHSGTYGLQTAPGHFVSTDFLTTSLPVIYPVALSFFLFGTSILDARMVMVIFMGLLCVFSYFLIRMLATERKRELPILSLYLLVTFAPLYGHGKNVLGEVPGLMFFVASLVAFHFAERRSGLWLWILSGAFLGLSATTKPIYLFIIAPSALLTLLIYRKRFSLKNIGVYAVSASSILMLWFFVHVTNVVALKEILLSANTNNVALSTRLFENGIRFVSEPQPLYFLALLALWWIALVYRRWKRIEISSVELFAGIFAVTNLILYLASRGFYRYFFPAEILALIFLPLALYTMPLKEQYRAIFLKACTAFIVFLVLLQGYQTFFRSWISEYRSSARSALLSEHLRGIPGERSVFFYNVPEAVIFLPSQNYYQYLWFGDNTIRGEENLPILFRGEPDFVLVDGKFPDTDKISPLYIEISRFDKYVLYEKKRK